MIRIEEIAESKQEHELLREKYLRQHKWDHVCNVPGSLWLWSKELPDGRVALVSESNAIDMQENWSIFIGAMKFDEKRKIHAERKA